MGRDGGMKSELGRWTIVCGPAKSRTVQEFGQLVELILAGKIGRDALLFEPAGQPRTLGDVPQLAVLFEDEDLRTFLRDRRGSASPWWSRAMVIAGVAVVLAVAGVAHLGGGHATSRERPVTTRSPATPRAGAPLAPLKGAGPERAPTPIADHAAISPIGPSLETASGIPPAGSVVTAGM